VPPQALVKRRSNTGPTLVQRWSNAGPRAAARRGSKAGQTLVRRRPSAGPTPVQGPRLAGEGGDRAPAAHVTVLVETDRKPRPGAPPPAAGRVLRRVRWRQGRRREGHA
jgi:hypothetical protein